MSIFSSVPNTNLSRSTFNLDHENKLSFDFGGLYPILTHLVLPGDKMSLAVQSFIRTLPLISPVMHRNDIKIDSFFVPLRLIWKDYEKWLQCTDTTIKIPQLKFSESYNISVKNYEAIFGVGSLADYLGFASVPSSSFATDGEVGSEYIVDSNLNNRTFNLLPFRTYALIYDYYYRNKTLEKSLFDHEYGYTVDGNSDVSVSSSWMTYQKEYYSLRYRSWRRDMFTSSLPNPQNGNPILLPESDLDISASGNFNLNYTDPSSMKDNDVINLSSSGAMYKKIVNQDAPSNAYPQSYNSGLQIEKTNSPTLEDLRYAEVLDEYDEALARAAAGKRGAFKEWLIAIWRTISPDARLDRPEYLGGYRGPIQISEIPQTSSTDVSSPQGTLAGKGLSVGGNLLFKNKHFSEPGFLMVIMSVVPKSAYFQGDPRQYLYDSPFDFPNPYFANLGEQEVKLREISASHAACNDEAQQTFGYQVRNYEMKQIPDSIHGQLRSSLLYWHEARVFDDYNYSGGSHQVVPNLNSAFVKVSPIETNRIFPVQSGDKLIGEFYFSFKAKRSLPYYGVPRFGHNR